MRYNNVCMCCNGLGYISDHTPAHYANPQDIDCSKYGCPTQVECEECSGTGCVKGEDESDETNLI